MSRQRSNVRALLRRASAFTAGVLTGSAMAAPALAAPDLAIGNLTGNLTIGDISVSQPLVLGSLVLLVIGLALKARYRKAAPPPVRNDFNEGIGRYRLQLGRGDAY